MRVRGPRVPPSRVRTNVLANSNNDANHALLFEMRCPRRCLPAKNPRATSAYAGFDSNHAAPRSKTTIDASRSRNEGSNSIRLLRRGNEGESLKGEREIPTIVCRDTREENRERSSKREMKECASTYARARERRLACRSRGMLS